MGHRPGREAPHECESHAALCSANGLVGIEYDGVSKHVRLCKTFHRKPSRVSEKAKLCIRFPVVSMFPVSSSQQQESPSSKLCIDGLWASLDVEDWASRLVHQGRLPRPLATQLGIATGLFRLEWTHDMGSWWVSYPEKNDNFTPASGEKRQKQATSRSSSIATCHYWCCSQKVQGRATVEFDTCGAMDVWNSKLQKVAICCNDFPNLQDHFRNIVGYWDTSFHRDIIEACFSLFFNADEHDSRMGRRDSSCIVPLYLPFTTVIKYRNHSFQLFQLSQNADAAGSYWCAERKEDPARQMLARRFCHSQPGPGLGTSYKIVFLCGELGQY